MTGSPLLLTMLALGTCLYALLLASRLLPLAPYRVGWLMYLANLFWELLEKRAKLERLWLEAAAAVAALALIGLGGARPDFLALLALLLLALELGNRLWERSVLTSIPGRLDVAGLQGADRGIERFPAPSVHAHLTLTLEAPFVSRVPDYQLGTLSPGKQFDLELIIGNHTPTPTQQPVQVAISAAAWLASGDARNVLPAMNPGTVTRLRWTLLPLEDAPAGELELSVSWDGEHRIIKIAYDCCRRIDASEIREATLKRYPGARQAAFAWRGDMDVYDTSSFQSIGGLETALGLGSRYGIAQTMYVSTRLTLDPVSASEWAEHYGVDRGAEQIPQFIEWLRREADIKHTCPYPATSERRYVLEIGNHGHLHFDTDTAGAPENAWKAGARAGQGYQYPWVGEDRSSFGEQRDNIIEAQRWIERCLDFSPRSWAKPGRGNDASTPAAVAAAGLEVASGCDISALDNAVRQPRPHQPMGKGLVELTARYPSDPQHIYHLAMLNFWLHRSHRLGIPMILMVHQHLRQFSGGACLRFTEWLLRRALEGFHGDFYMDTVYGIGSWWRDVLSPQNSVVRLSQSDGRLQLTNSGDRDLANLPIDILLADGSRTTRIVTARARDKVDVEV